CEGYFYIKFQDEFGKLGYTKEQLSRGRVQDSPYSVYEPISNTLNLKTKFRQNNYGFRDEEDTREKRPGEFRIFILGGSGALGQGAMQQFIQISGQQEYPSKYTISARLEEKLKTIFPHTPIEVINAAVSGYKVNHEYGFYMSTIRKLSPDLVILLDGYNDLFFPLDGKFYVGDVDREAWKDNTYRKNLTYKIGMFLMSKSYTFFYLGKKLFTEKYQYEEEIFKKWLTEPMQWDTAGMNAQFNQNLPAIQYGMDDIFKRYEIFKHTCEIDSVDILFCPQPLLSLKPNKTAVETALHHYNLSESTAKAKMMERNGYQYFLRRFDEFAAAQNLHYLNLQNEINKTDKEIFVDYCHLSFQGNEMIAELLKDKIVKMNIIPERQNTVHN
ncbi:MAG: SGNH/GDSL hydrolase family protein, partial [Thermoanaerobaculia bacterium]|nr:SGNH/GDSL hydrolase family protein [Thermoanaerobaculia bacterium]